MRDPNAFQGRGRQPPVDGTGVVLGVIYGAGVWAALSWIAKALGWLP